MDSIYKINPNAKIISMGDLNDGTYNKSVKEGIGAKLKKSEVQAIWRLQSFRTNGQRRKCILILQRCRRYF